jgi:hypothetical protein
MDLGGVRTLRALQVHFVDHHSDLFSTDSTVYTRFRVVVSADGEGWTTVADLSDERRDRATPYVELPEPVRARWVRYEHVRSAPPNLAIGDLRVFGNAEGPTPPTPTGVRARRGEDPRSVFITWDPVPDAVGYNVLWGIGPGKLHQTWQVFADRPRPLEIRALTVGQDYWIAVEVFDERGVSAPSAPVHVR